MEGKQFKHLILKKKIRKIKEPEKAKHNYPKRGENLSEEYFKNVNEIDDTGKNDYNHKIYSIHSAIVADPKISRDTLIRARPFA